MGYLGDTEVSVDDSVYIFNWTGVQCVHAGKIYYTSCVDVQQLNV